MVELFGLHPTLLSQHLSEVVEKTVEMILDGSPSVRRAYLALLEFLFEALEQVRGGRRERIKREEGGERRREGEQGGWRRREEEGRGRRKEEMILDGSLSVRRA
jgi:hypothetical protein